MIAKIRFAQYTLSNLGIWLEKWAGPNWYTTHLPDKRHFTNHFPWKSQKLFISRNTWTYHFCQCLSFQPLVGCSYYSGKKTFYVPYWVYRNSICSSSFSPHLRSTCCTLNQEASSSMKLIVSISSSVRHFWCWFVFVLAGGNCRHQLGQIPQGATRIGRGRRACRWCWKCPRETPCQEQELRICWTQLSGRRRRILYRNLLRA